MPPAMAAVCAGYGEYGPTRREGRRIVRASRRSVP